MKAIHAIVAATLVTAPTLRAQLVADGAVHSPQPMKFFLSLCLSLLFTVSVQAQSGPGNALFIAGTINHVAVPHTAAFNSLPITVMAWVNTSVTTGQQGLVNKYVANSLNGWNVFLLNGRVRAWYFVSGTRNVYGGGDGLDGGFIADGRWHHIALVVDSSGGSIYVDGVEQQSRLWTGAFGAPTTTQEVRIGGYPGGNAGFTGSVFLDDVSVWNVGLNFSQIQTSRNGGLTGLEANRLAYYLCNESTGATVADSAPLGGSNNGTWVGLELFASVIPSIQTLPASAVDFTQATLNGIANPNRSVITAGFEWGTTTNYGSVGLVNTIGGASATVQQSYSLIATGLTSGTTYNFRAIVSNSIVGVSGVNQTFRTLGMSVLFAETLPASAVTESSAVLNGAANPLGASTSAWFEWGSTTNYGNVTPAQALGSGTNNTSFSQSLTGLFGGITYHFRAVASNSSGTVFGRDQSFGPLPVFTDIGAGLPGVGFSSTAWGDYDNDGRLDILLTGDTITFPFNSRISQVWRNTGSGFTNVSAALSGVFGGSAAWGDYDDDGRLDILLTGEISISEVWRNTASGFMKINAGLSEVALSSVAWGDYDNDGRLDVLLTGTTNGPGGAISQVCRNIGGRFIDSLAGLPGVQYGSAAWGDYDNDGRLDILLTGTTDGTEDGALSQVWRNTGSGFTNINAGLPAVYRSCVAWGDYDNDGLLDILLTGSTATSPISQVWRNTGSGFTNINAGLPGVTISSVAWGDYDNDGRLDILLTGNTTNLPISRVSQVWRNTGSGFTDIAAGLPGVRVSSVALGDYDNDGRLDILLTGETDIGNYISQIWRNNTRNTNTPPSAPSGLNVTIAGVSATFTWNAASDAQTPANGLSYNLRVGTTPGGGELVGPMAGGSGLRRLPQRGNAQTVNFRSVTLPLGQPLYWSVQAVDTAFAGGPFAPEQSFSFNSVFTPTNGIPVPGDINGDGIVSQSELAGVLTNLNGNGILTEADLNLVLSNYFAISPWLYMTNIAGLGGTNVTFALTNSLAGAFSVEYTTNLVDWQFLGPATTRYLFTDTNAPAEPQRYYRLRWP